MQDKIQQYLKKCSADGLADVTIEGYKWSLQTFSKWWDSRDFSQINDDDIIDYKAYLRELPSLSNTTVNNRLRDLKVFMNYATIKGWCPKVKIKLLSLQDPDIIPLDDDQLKELYAACMIKKTLNRVRDKTIMRLMEETGVRLKECMGILVTDVVLREGKIKLRNTKNKKNDDIYLTPAMKKELSIYMDARIRWLNEKGLKSNHLWISTNARTLGQPLRPRTIEGQIRYYGEIAGITNVRVSPHTFRHTFARNFIVNGGDMLMLQKLLRHSSLGMVLKYVHLFGTDRQNTYLKIMEKRTKNQKKEGKKKWPLK